MNSVMEYVLRPGADGCAVSNDRPIGVHKQPILVTGSKGLIGRALTGKLLSVGQAVLPWDIEIAPFMNVAEDTPQLREAIAKCGGVVHLAAVSRVIDAERDPEKCWRVNVEGTRNILGLLHEVDNPYFDIPDHPWFIYGSSREVYGQPRDLPVDEETPLLPVNIYGYSKLLGEAMVRGMTRNMAIIRFSNVFGDLRTDHHDRVVPAFIRAAVSNDTIRVDGTDTLFDFTYIDDVVRGVLSMVSRLQLLPDRTHCVQLTSGVGTSLYELARTIIELTNSTSEITVAPPRSFDVSHFCGDNQLAQHLLSWHPERSLASNLWTVIQDFRARSMDSR